MRQLSAINLKPSFLGGSYISTFRDPPESHGSPHVKPCPSRESRGPTENYRRPSWAGNCLHRMPSWCHNVTMTLRHSKGPACYDFSHCGIFSLVSAKETICNAHGRTGKDKNVENLRKTSQLPQDVYTGEESYVLQLKVGILIIKMPKHIPRKLWAPSFKADSKRASNCFCLKFMCSQVYQQSFSQTLYNTRMPTLPTLFYLHHLTSTRSVVFASLKYKYHIQPDFSSHTY